jgi:asparagine synthase (glutamine-hydrolysing)
MNGAITNDGELLARLWPRWSKHRPRRGAPNDAWLPLLAVRNGDVEALRALRGHHAYAVVDTQDDTLVFGQDRYGEKPFWGLVERRGGTLELVAFASTPAALRRLGAPAFGSPRRLAELFRFGFAPHWPQRVSTRQQLVVPPRGGEPLLARGAGRTWCQPWQPARTVVAPDAADLPPTAGVDQLAVELMFAVSSCVDTRVPVGLSLSGGLDSSCLALTLRMFEHTVPAYHLHAAGTDLAERRAAVAVAQRANLPLHTVDVGPEVLTPLAMLTAHAGMPLGDPSVLAVHAVARAAAADGVRVLLGGEGADELFLGYRRYRALSVLPPLRPLQALRPRWSTHYAARWWRAATAPDPTVALLAVTPPAFAEVVLAPALARRGVWRDRALWRPRPEVTTPLPAAGDRVQAARAHDLAHYLRFDLLPKVDVATMAAGVEARCPYLDPRLASFGAARAALGKRPLRDAFAAELPPAVLHLPKRGFSLPLDRWFRGELPWLDLLAEPRTQQRPHLRPGGIARAVDLHRRGRVDLGHGLYLLVAVELFLRSQDATAKE